MAFSRFLPGFGTIKYYDLHILSAGNNSTEYNYPGGPKLPAKYQALVKGSPYKVCK
jgi:hypothetical protein